MRLSDKGLKMIQSFEGLRLQAYQDSADVWTIGYGHTEAVTPNQVITKEQAEIYLEHDLSASEKIVNFNVKVPITQNQYDALVSFTYNIGGAAFRKSTLLKLLNKGKPMEIIVVANEFQKWNKAGGKVVQGLVNRRLKEKELFLTWN